MRWVFSERQYADGLTKTSTRSLLVDRLRYGRIKLVWDPSQLCQCKEENERRERQEQTRVRKRALQEKNHNNIHKPQTSTTKNTTQAEQEFDDLERTPVQAVAWNNTSSSSKIPLTALVCYTQVKAVLAGNHFIQALDVDTCPVEQEYFWSPLTVLCTLLMLFSAILTFATYKFGRFLERRHWRNLVNTRIRVDDRSA